MMDRESCNAKYKVLQTKWDGSGPEHWWRDHVYLLHWVGQIHHDQTHPEMWVIVFVKFHNIIDPRQGIDDYFLYMGYTIQLDDRWYTRELQCKWAK